MQVHDSSGRGKPEGTFAQQQEYSCAQVGSYYIIYFYDKYAN